VIESSSIALFSNIPPKVDNNAIEERFVMLVESSSATFPPPLQCGRRRAWW